MKRKSPKIQTCELLLMICSFFTLCSKLVKSFDFFHPDLSRSKRNQKINKPRILEEAAHLARCLQFAARMLILSFPPGDTRCGV